VAEQFVWHTVQHSLEPLLAVVESEIARLPEKAFIGPLSSSISFLFKHDNYRV
jgi:hypothetical protein